MVAKMANIFFLILFLSVTTSYAQSEEAIKKEQEKYIQKQYDEYKGRVDTFVNLLEIDEFKGEIIKQKIDDFYKERNQILRSEISEYEKEPLVDQLMVTHFSDVKELFSEDVITSIQLFLRDNKAHIKKLQKRQKTKTKN